MATADRKGSGTVTPTADESAQARELGRRLAPYLKTDHALHVQVVEEGQPREVVSIPGPALRLLGDILTELADGNAVSVVPTKCALTTQQAADLLNVSRPYLIGLLDHKQIPSHKIGTHRRVFFEDLIRFKEAADAARRRSLAELAALSQELGLGY